MRDDRLRQLLRQADASADGPPALPADFAARVRRLDVRRRRVRVGVGAAAAVLMAVGLTSLWSWPAVGPVGVPAETPQVVVVPLPPTEFAEISAELRRLRAEVELRTTVARQMDQRLELVRRTDEVEQVPAPPDAVAAVREQMDQAAFVLVQNADRMCRDLDLCKSAEAKYRRVLELFPGSPWATVARQRLNELQHRGALS